MPASAIGRRRLLAAAAALAAAPPRAARGQPAVLPVTPACEGAARATPRQTEGPFYTPGSPRRHSLLTPDRPGERLVLAGFVLARDCRPLAGALVDLWHADGAGAYDNAGFDLRGHVRTDAQGRWWFETIVPGLYPGRTRHAHVKVAAPGARMLTTQLYFPSEPGNARDGLFDPALTLAMDRAAGVGAGRFDFVLDAG